MSSANVLMWKKFIIWGGSIIGSGVLLFKYTTPTEEQLIARLSPELRQEYEHNKQFRRKEQEELIKIVKETSKSNEPVWKTGPIQSPWDRDTATSGLPKGPELLLKREKFEKERAAKSQLSEIERLKQQEVEIAEATNSKSKWVFWK